MAKLTKDENRKQIQPKLDISDVSKSLPTTEMILNKAKDLALSYEDETADTYATVELTTKDLLWLVDFAKGNVC